MNLMSFVRKLIYPEINLILGIDIDSDSIKISEVRYRKGIKPYFKNFAIETIPQGLVDNGYIINEAGFVDFFKEILARNFFSTNYAVVSINSRDMVLRQIELPLMARSEASEVLHWDLEKYVPSAANEEHYYDMHVLSESSENKQMRILLIAVPKRIVDSLMVVMGEVGLKLLAVDSEVLALGRTVPSDGNRIVVDIDRLYTKIIVFESGVPMISRLIALGWDRVEDVLKKLADKPTDVSTTDFDTGKSKELTELDNNRLNLFVDDLTRDVIRTITYFQSTNPMSVVDKFLLIGENLSNPEITDRFESRLKMQVDVVDLFDYFNINSTFKREFLKQYETQLMISVGLALWGEGDIV